MPPQTLQAGRSGLVRGVFLFAVAWVASPLAAQELTLLRDYPGAGPYECPAPPSYAPPSPEERAQAGQLASDAGQAVVLGDFLRAEQLLGRASQLDPESAEYAYRRARVLEDQGLASDAMFEYCRAIQLGAEELGIVDSRARIDMLNQRVRDEISEPAREGFVTGLLQADAGRYQAAVASFSIAIREAPDWPAPVFNRAAVLERLGRIQESLVDYRLYLAVTPSEVDPVVALVSERIGALEGLVSLPTPSASGALALGVLFPGMGHYYTGRRGGGTLILSLAAGAIAAGAMVKEVTVRCLNLPQPGGDCPPDEIVDESSRRPYLIPALGAAGLVTLVGAVEAFVRARRRSAEREALQQPIRSVGPRLTGPSVSRRGDRVDLTLLGLRFR